MTKQPASDLSGISREATMAGEQALRKFADEVGEQVRAQMGAIFNL